MKRLALALLLSLFAIAAYAQNISGYPPGADAIQVSTTGTTGTITTTLTGVAGRTTYICGFVVTSGGTTAAAIVNVTISGMTNTLNFAYVGVTTGQGVLGIPFPQCLPASVSGGNIVVNMPALGAGTVVAAVTAWGYRL